jgi:hypothetical protein
MEWWNDWGNIPTTERCLYEAKQIRMDGYSSFMYF